MVRTDRFKLIVGTGRRDRQDGYQTGKPLPGPYQHLFDVVDDPDETNDLGDGPGHQAIKADLLHKMYLREISTRDGLEPAPPGLTELETIHWCLVPRDRAAPNAARPPSSRPARSVPRKDAKKTPSDHKESGTDRPRWSKVS